MFRHGLSDVHFYRGEIVMIEIPELISLVNSTNYLIDSFINKGCRNI